jgi:hypothetical protein
LDSRPTELLDNQFSLTLLKGRIHSTNFGIAKAKP